MHTFLRKEISILFKWFDTKKKNWKDVNDMFGYHKFALILLLKAIRNDTSCTLILYSRWNHGILHELMNTKRTIIHLHKTCIFLLNSFKYNSMNIKYNHTYFEMVQQILSLWMSHKLWYKITGLDIASLPKSNMDI